MSLKQKRKNIKSISEYFPATYGDKSYQQDIKDFLAKKTKIGTDNIDTHNTSEISTKNETEHLVRITRQNNEYETTLGKQNSVDDKLYSNHGLTSTSIIEMKNIKKDQKSDREFIKTTLKALYHSDPIKLNSKSMKGSGGTTKITPEKHEKLKNIFLERLNHSTKNNTEVDARFAKLSILASKCLYDIKHQQTKTKNDAESKGNVEDQIAASNTDSGFFVSISPYFLQQTMNADPSIQSLYTSQQLS